MNIWNLRTSRLVLLPLGVILSLFILIFNGAFLRWNIVTSPLRSNSLSSASKLTTPRTKSIPSPNCPSDDEIRWRAQQRKEDVRTACERYQLAGKLEKYVDFALLRQSHYTRFASDDFSPVTSWWLDFHAGDKYRIIFCGVNKSGSSNIFYYLFKLYSSNGNGTYDYNFHVFRTAYSDVAYKRNEFMCRFEAISSREARQKLASYFKFVFFRDPLERLVSAWQFVFHGQWARRAIKELAGKIVPQSKSGTVRQPSLREFFEHLAKENDAAKFNHHWRPQSLLAYPCEIQYDFIGSTSDLSCEVEFLARQFTGLSRVPQMPRSKSSSNSSSWQSLPAALVRSVLQKHYKIDYDLLGFKEPSFADESKG